MREMSDKAIALRALPALRSIEAELAIYEALLRKWQARINLVSAATLEYIWTRHFADSAQLLSFAPEARHWIDLGSGGGFPGIVVALLLKAHGSGQVTLVESDSRKAAFLREVSRETSAPAVVVNARAETLAPDLDLDVVTSRALAPVSRMAETITPWLQRGATGLFLTGEGGPGDVPANLHAEVSPSRTGPGFVVKVTFRESRLS